MWDLTTALEIASKQPGENTGEGDSTLTSDKRHAKRIDTCPRYKFQFVLTENCRESELQSCPDLLALSVRPSHYKRNVPLSQEILSSVRNDVQPRKVQTVVEVVVKNVGWRRV